MREESESGGGEARKKRGRGSEDREEIIEIRTEGEKKCEEAKGVREQERKQRGWQRKMFKKKEEKVRLLMDYRVGRREEEKQQGRGGGDRGWSEWG